MKILYLAHRIPYPPNKGDKIRSFNEIKFLSQRHKIDLICLADNFEDLHFKKDLEKYCNQVFIQPFQIHLAKIKGILSLLSGKSISVGYFYHKKVQFTFNQWIEKNKYEAIVCFSSPMAEYIFKSEAFQLSSFQASWLFLIMDFCDLDSDKWRQYAQQSRFPFNILYDIEFKRLFEFEKEINQKFDHSIFVSDREANLFYKLYPDAINMHVIPNGVDYEYFSPEIASDQNTLPAMSYACPVEFEKPSTGELSPILLFTGAMDYHANIDGVTWFHDKVLPMIKKEYPQVQFFIVGSKPAKKVMNFSTNNGVKVTGFVDDVKPLYNLADISITPLRLARGVQNKVLEAMAMEKPVVATSKAAGGINAIPGSHLLVADEPAEFASKICSLLRNKSHREQIGKNARQFVKKDYNWESNLNKFEEILKAGKPGSSKAGRLESS